MISEVLIGRIPELAAMAVFLLCSAFFSAAETALFSLSPEDLKRLKEKPGRAAWCIHALLEDPQRLLASILFGNMVVNISVYSLSFLVAVQLSAVSHLAAAVAGVGSLLAVILLGEVSPKGIAIGRPMAVARRLAPALYVFDRVVRPISATLKFIARKGTGFFVEQFSPLPYVTREELKLLVGMAQQQGTLDQRTRGMIEEVVELAEMRAREVMTPRVDMAAFNLADGREALCALIRRTHTERFVAYEGQVDNVLGMLSARDVFLRPDMDLRALLRPVRFVPETQSVETLLRQFSRSTNPVAIAVDEFGGVAGLITPDHILHQVVGEFRDGNAPREQPVQALDEDTYLLAGDLNTRDWPQLLGAGFNTPHVETIGGFMMSLLGRLPRAGDRAVWRGLEFVVERMAGRRVAQVRVQRLRPKEPA